MSDKVEREWWVPVIIVERGRVARVTAASKREAQQKARRADWTDCSEADDHDVRVAGKITEAD